MLQDQISQRNDYKKNQTEEDRQAMKDALDQEMHAFKRTEMQKMQEKNKQKMMYRQMLDDQISNKASMKGGEPNLPPQSIVNDFSYRNVGQPGYEELGQNRRGMPSTNPGVPPGADVMQRKIDF